MFYAVVGVSGRKKGDNFRAMDRVLIGPFDITAYGNLVPRGERTCERGCTCGGRWAEEPEQWTGRGKRFIFLLPSFRASCKMPRLARLAHKARVI